MPAGNGCTAWATSTCSTGLTCERLPPAGCEDPSWAEWSMPNGPAEVAAGGANPQSYTDDGDGTVTDKITGLMWQQAAPATMYSWADALTYCPTLTLGGHGDWRLPTVIELSSLVDRSTSTGPTINTTAFPNAPTTYFWTSSPSAGSPTSAWAVSFGSGFVSGNAGSSGPFSVRCVR